MAKKVMVDGVEVKAGMKIAVTNWLSFPYEVVGVERANKIYISSSAHAAHYEILTKTRKPGMWKLNGYSFVKVDFNPNWNEHDAHNKAIEESETWMCM